MSDQLFMQMAKEMRMKSGDPSTKVGAVIIHKSEKGGIPGGYNSFPPGVLETEERMNNREEKYPRIVHAEMNALMDAIAIGLDVRKGTIYVTEFPCASCCGVLITSGIRRVVAQKPTEDFLSRWSTQISISMSMLEEAGVELTLVSR